MNTSFFQATNVSRLALLFGGSLVTGALAACAPVGTAHLGDDGEDSLGGEPASTGGAQNNSGGTDGVGGSTGGAGGSADPCAGKACGESCSVCTEGPCLLIDLTCDANGDCGGGAACKETEPYDPCAGKACGEDCSLCAPDDSDCTETTEVKACNARGQCAGGSAPSCDDDQACSPGDTKTVDCNTCDCVEERWVCTDIACTPEEEPCGDSNECTDEEYCAFPGSEGCDDGALGRCLPRPDACDLVYDPVCGCDGNTYGNACAAAIEGVSVGSSGACEN